MVYLGKVSSDMGQIIADAGGSKTCWAYIYEGEVRFIETSGIHPFYLDTAQIIHLLEDELIGKISGLAIREVVFYGAGCSQQSRKQIVASALQACFRQASIIVEHDLLGAARALWQCSSGIAAIMGTGVNVGLYNGDRIVYSPPSLGFWLGDEGSGAYLGKEWCIAYLHGEVPAELSAAFARTYNIDIDTVLQAAYDSRRPNRYFAQFLPFLLSNQMHPFVASLLQKGVELFFRRYVCRVPNYNNYRLALTGSVAYHLRGWVEQCAHQYGIELYAIEPSPIYGLLEYHQISNS